MFFYLLRISFLDDKTIITAILATSFSMLMFLRFSNLVFKANLPLDLCKMIGGN
ncbi:hypothetical protein K501DRAFT_288228, partial [Backusella circina FSU 941]